LRPRYLRLEKLHASVQQAYQPERSAYAKRFLNEADAALTYGNWKKAQNALQLIAPEYIFDAEEQERWQDLNIRVEGSKVIDNEMFLAREAYDNGNWQKAIDYCETSIEIWLDGIEDGEIKEQWLESLKNDKDIHDLPQGRFPRAFFRKAMRLKERSQAIHKLYPIIHHALRKQQVTPSDIAQVNNTFKAMFAIDSDNVHLVAQRELWDRKLSVLIEQTDLSIPEDEE
jgi:hypothetical protein